MGPLAWAIVGAALLAAGVIYWFLADSLLPAGIFITVAIIALMIGVMEARGG